MAMNNKGIIIAIDGHSSTGKSTFAREIALRYDLTYIDTGALYRGITLIALENNIFNPGSSDEESKLSEILSQACFQFLSGKKGKENELHINGRNVEKEIRSIRIAEKVSIYAAMPYIREFVDSLLKDWGKKGGVVMDGRDIGTVVFPDADIKIFMTASAEIRAQRRYRQMQQNGEIPDYRTILKNVKERDFLDETRKTAPLKMAKDAILLDNSNMTQEDQMRWIEQIIDQKCNSGRR
jgi:cytidylate kinase